MNKMNGILTFVMSPKVKLREINNFNIFLNNFYFIDRRKGQDNCFALIHPFRGSSIKLVTSGKTK